MTCRWNKKRLGVEGDGSRGVTTMYGRSLAGELNTE